MCAALAMSAGAAAWADDDAPVIGKRDGVKPDATMLQFPDVSSTHIVFVYGNDLWLVERAGGTATPLVSPDGKEGFPKFNDSGDLIAFMGNYEGDMDVYVVPTDGGVAERVTHHPATEVVTGWTPDGDILFWQNGLNGLGRQQSIFSVAPSGGLPEKMPVPYGTNGAVSDDGEWLAYTPFSRDTRTWKRYRGGMASDVWLFNLNTYESQRITDWEGTDTLPMWSGSTVYYLSDAGPAHRLNIWSYDTSNGQREQVTSFTDYDVKWPSMGPGNNGRGEIVFQNGSQIYLLDLASERARPVEIIIPGDRPALREVPTDFSENITDIAVSPSGNRVVVSARGDIFSLPAAEGVTRSITRTDDAHERDPSFSPNGKWIVYLSDASGEYEFYMKPSDGKGEAVQLTDAGGPFKSMGSWSPDSKHFTYTDKGANLFLYSFGGENFDEAGTATQIYSDAWAQSPDVSWSHDSGWLAWTGSDEANQAGVVMLYDIAQGATHRVTDPMFNATAVTFDNEGDWLYFASDRNFSPNYSSVDSTWIYEDSTVVLAVPLREDVENHTLAISDEVEIKEEKKKSKKGDEDGEGDESTGEEVSVAGVWKGSVTITPGGDIPDMPPMPCTLEFYVDEDDGSVTGTFIMQGESIEMQNIAFDASSGEMTFKVVSDAEYDVTLSFDGDSFEGEWTNAAGMSGTMAGGRDDEDGNEDSDDGDDEALVIDLEGFESRAIRIDSIDPGSVIGLMVNDKNELIFATLNMERGSGPMGAELHLVNFLADEEDGRATKKIISGIMAGAMTADNKSILVRTPAGMGVIKAAPSQSVKDKVPTDSMKRKVSPRQEWRQLVTEAWRLQRDYFYDAGLHGMDWDAVLARYLPLVDDCVVRDDVTFIIQELISELNVGHAYYRARPDDRGPSENVGMLGCDFELASTDEGSGFRISKIYKGAPWDDDARGPLSQPGVDINVGDFILAVNGIEVDTGESPWAPFVGLANKTVGLTVSTKPVIDDDAREVLVKPISSESGLRYRAWVERNRAYVDYRTGGRIGYIFVPNTGVQGQNELMRQFYGQKGKDGLIIDDRWNGGGQIPTRFIELMNRPRTNYWAVRDGKDWAWPPDSHQGPKVMLINGMAGSGGDMFPALFRQSGLGKLVGTRTWGGLVGISGNPQLMDGTAVTVPTFGYYEKDGTWGIEGHGVDPDIEVIADPAKMIEAPNAGPEGLADPQLDAAIEQVMSEVRANPYSPPARPASPDRSGMGITDQDK